MTGNVVSAGWRAEGSAITFFLRYRRPKSAGRCGRERTGVWVGNQRVRVRVRSRGRRHQRRGPLPETDQRGPQVEQHRPATVCRRGLRLADGGFRTVAGGRR